jgi:hypothetical protein
MKASSLRLFLIVFCMGMLACLSTLWGDPPDRVGRLNFVTGTVSFRPESIEEWAAASLNYPLTIGDHLWTDKDGQAEVHIGSTAIRLAPSTDFSFLNLNDQTIQIRLSTGSLDIRLRHMDPAEEIEVDTPNASLSLLRAGTYRVDVQQGGDTAVTVRSGEIEATAGSAVFPLRLGQTAAIAGLESPTYQVVGAATPDDWDLWCQARDQKEDQVASAQYVPRDQIDGVEDLDQYGSWSNEADLGPVWAPTVIVAGWAPYRFGHWAWVDPWGWTWIDDAPWGFAPFHYGRWAFRNSGWRWVPGARMSRAVYAPALVTFIGGPEWRPGSAPGGSVGWFPLGPHEPFIPPYRTNRTLMHNVDVEHMTYVNRNVPGAVTVVPNETFIRGRSAANGALTLPIDELSKVPVQGAVAPLIPQKESLLGGYVATHGPIAQPPASVSSRQVVARLTPPSQPLPFAVRQQALAAHPGQPTDTVTLSRLKQSAPAVRSPVRVVTPGYPRKVVGQPPSSPQAQASQGPARSSLPRQPAAGNAVPAAQPPRRQPAEGSAGTATQPPPREPAVRQPPKPVQRTSRQPAAGTGRKGPARAGSGDDTLLLQPDD